MIRALLFALAMAGPALAETVKFQQSYVYLRDTDRQGAVAEIFYQNTAGDQYETGTVTVQHRDMTCRIDYASGGPEPDSIVPECEGLVAVPRSLTIADGTMGVIYLYAGSPMM